MDLKDKIVLITGSSRGIGAACAKAFADKGARVVIHYKSAKTKKEAEKIAKQCRAERCVQADVESLDECKKLIDAVVKKCGRIDVLVNNAGMNTPTPVGKTDAATWEKIVNTNLRAPFFLVQYALPHLPAGSAIVNLASIRSFRTRPSVAVYSLTKAGVKSLTETMANELAPGIRVNAIAPGYVDTDMLRAFPPEKIEQFRQSAALKRIIRPDEIAHAAVFLAENDAVTGHTLVVDGGYLIQ